MKVIVLDGEQRSALAMTRSLGQKGIEVIVGAETNPSLAGVSNFCYQSFTYPSPITNSEKFIEKIEFMAQEQKAFALFPMTDVTTYEVFRKRERLECVTKIPGVAIETFEKVSDKFKLFQEAERMGVSIPKTLYIEDQKMLWDMKNEIPFPAVLKPGRSKIINEGKLIQGKVLYAGNMDELLNICQNEDAFKFPFLIQEKIEGPGAGVFVLIHEGKAVALFSHKRIREKPPSGGVSVLRESIEADARAAHEAVKLLNHFAWEGIAMVEFKIDLRNGFLRLMEINGRFWGSLQLAIDSGVDFPFLLFQSLQSIPIKPVMSYTLGTKTRWLLGDLDHLLLRLFKKEKQLHLPDHYPSRIKSIINFINFSNQSSRLEVFSKYDPRPFLHELRLYLKNFFLR